MGSHVAHVTTVTNSLNFSLCPLPFPGGSDDKESACNAGDPGWIPGTGRSSGEGNDYQLQYSLSVCLFSTPVFLPGEFHGQRSLMGYSPWDHRVGHN